MNKKQLLWDLFMNTGKFEYYIEYKKVNDNEVINIDFTS